jgi:hypothetical protein
MQTSPTTRPPARLKLFKPVFKDFPQKTNALAIPVTYASCATTESTPTRPWASYDLAARTAHASRNLFRLVELKRSNGNDAG